MATGYSLHIGLDYVDPRYYRGDEGHLFVCTRDMKAMHGIAQHEGFVESVLLANEEATIGRFLQEMKRFSQLAKAGDLFYLSFSGHGTLVKDLDGDEKSGMDQSWCFYDGFVVDDRINELLCEFAPGCRILMTSDSCYSETIFKDGMEGTVKKKVPKEQPMPAASVVLLSAALESMPAYNGKENGQFTSALLEVWANGNFEDDYEKYIRQVRLTLGNRQVAMLHQHGYRDPAFLAQKPFTI